MALMTMPDPELPEYVDPNLWFDSDAGRMYLLADNPQTFPGRMLAYRPTHGDTICVSKNEILESCSEQTRYFVLGYLSGNEPGPPAGHDGHPVDLGDPLYDRWSAARREYHQTGVYYEPRNCERCGAELDHANQGYWEWPNSCEPCLELRPSDSDESRTAD